MERQTENRKRRLMLEALEVLLAVVLLPLRWSVLAVLGLVTLGLCCGGPVAGVYSYSAGEMVEATVLDTWTRTECTRLSPGGELPYQCSEPMAEVAFLDHYGREQTTDIEGSYEVGDKTEIFVGPLAAGESRLWVGIGVSLAGMLLGGVSLQFLVFVKRLTE